MRLFTFVLCSFIALSAFASETKIYRWVTEDGQVIFSDQPIPGAKSIDLTAKVQNVAESNKPKTMPAPPPPAKRKVIQLAFLDFQDQATVHSAAGELTLTAQSDIPFGVTQTLQLLLDGKPYGKPQSGMQFKLSNLDRGEHKVQLQLLNTQGDVLTKSESITFYMHRPSSKHN